MCIYDYLIDVFFYFSCVCERVITLEHMQINSLAILNDYLLFHFKSRSRSYVKYQSSRSSSKKLWPMLNFVVCTHTCKDGDQKQ